MKKMFHFDLLYFKESGKFYSEGEVDWEVSVCGEDGKIAYMHDAVDKIKEIREGNNTDTMPGLLGKGKDFFVVIDSPDGHPVLIKPVQKINHDSKDEWTWVFMGDDCWNFGPVVRGFVRDVKAWVWYAEPNEEYGVIDWKTGGWKYRINDDNSYTYSGEANNITDAIEKAEIALGIKND